MKPAFRRSTATLLLFALAACTTVRPVTAPKSYITARTPTIVWVKRTTPGPTLALEGPRIVGDTLVGFDAGEYIELPFSQIEQVQARQPHRGKTVALVAALALAAAGLTFVISGGHGFGDDYEEEGFRPRR